MFLRIKRILMAEADAPSGNGAAPAAPAETPAAQPQAQGAQPPAIDVNAIAGKVSDTVFAALRKAGVFDKPQPKPDKKADDAAPTQTQAPQVDPIKLRVLDRALARRGKTDIPDSRWQRIEKAYIEEQPSDVDAWLGEWFDGPASAPAAQPVTQQAPQPKPEPVAPHPVSNRGAPQATQTPVEEANLWTASDADRKAFIAQKGVREYVRTLQKQGKGRPVQIGKR